MGVAISRPKSGGSAEKSCKPGAEWTDTVAILAGEDETEFVVHKRQLCSKSRFFTNNFSRPWLEADENVIHLPNISEEYFSVYAEWAYTSTLSTAVFERCNGDELDFDNTGLSGDEQQASVQLHKLCEMWVHADLLGDAYLKNTIIDRMTGTEKFAQAWMSPATITAVWDNTTDEAGIKKWLVDVVSTRLTPARLDQYGDEIPHGLMREVLKKKLSHYGLVESTHKDKDEDSQGQPETIDGVKEPDSDDDMDDYQPMEEDEATTILDEDEPDLDRLRSELATVWPGRCKYHEHGPGIPACR